MTDPTIIPAEIAHLDWDPEEETPKTCRLLLPHPNVKGELVTCGIKAVYMVSLNKPCGHVNDVYLCATCWERVEGNSTRKWRCLVRTSGEICNKYFIVPPAVTSWKRL